MNLSAILLATLISVQTDPGPWKLEKDKDGIQVFTRLPEGRKIKEFKAITTVQSTLHSVVALVLDTEAAPKWYNHVASGKKLKALNEQRSIVRLELDFPFPANDRDMIADFDYSYDRSTRTVNCVVKGMPDYLPEDEDFIRIKEVEGYWKFTAIDKETVEVVYQFFADPGGSLPVWAINMFIVDDPYKSLKRMHEFVRQAPYKDARLPFIVE